MVWFRVDDKLWGNQKWLAVSPAARALWVTAGSWCGDQLTDGYVPRHVLSTLAGRPRDAAELVAAGLWKPEENGWRFHDWLDWNRSREAVLAEREAAAERQRRAREKAASQRESQQSHAVTDTVIAPVTNGVSHTHSHASVTVPPTRPDLSSGSLGGERPETLHAIPATTPLQDDETCTRHPHGNPTDEPCRGCQRVEQRKQRRVDQAAERAARQAEERARNCPACEGTHFILDDDKRPTGRRCDHRRTA